MRAILTYHSIDSSGSCISVDPAVFAGHVRWLASGRVRVTTLTDLLRTSPGDDAVAITFDDALESFAREAWPRLDAHGLPATVFVATGHVGRDNRWPDSVARVPRFRVLDWPDLARLSQRGVQFGSHSRTHRDLRTLDAETLAVELTGSAGDLEAHLGTRPEVFAYPYGHVNDAVARATAGVYTLACTAAFGPLGPDDPLTRLPRLDMFYFRRTGQLERFGTAAFDRRVRIRRWLRGVRRRWQD